MASQEKVKKYLAYWFQLGKRVMLNGGQEAILPSPVIQGNRYSQEFEACWQRIIESKSDSYLEGTIQTIQQLLSPSWDIVDCARCNMPVPAIEIGIQPVECPCYDLPNWPNNELPAPRSPVNSTNHLNSIKDRLNRARDLR
jgi:hypothetical protein